MMLIRHMGLIGFMGILAPFVRADISAELAQASAPLSEGVPEVAVERLQTLLNRNRPDAEWRTVAEKLAEAQVAAKEPEDTLVLLADDRVRELPWAKFWRAQAFAGLNRWTDALPLYEQLANDQASPFRVAATFGAAEMLRALGKREDALRKLDLLFHNKEWAHRAQVRAAELYIEMGDAPGAQRLLEEIKPTSVAERREKRLLRGRLELILQRPERALGMFQALLKRPEKAGHAIFIAALFGIAEAHLQLKTPEAGDDIVEQFIDLHPADPDLPLLFEKLDELYRTENRPSHNELEKWVRRPEEPRRAFARWYLARLEIRAGRRERARQLFSDLRHTTIKSPVIARALLEFAQFEIQDRHFDEAITILDDARLLHPEPPLLARIDFLSAQAHYLAKRFDTATAAFEQIAHSNSPWAKAALFNASSGWLQLGNHARFLVDYTELEQQGGDKESRANLRLEEGLMQLAELYYRRQDFANAQTQFEIIAQQNPDQSLAERALFFAAESAMSSMGEHSLDRAIVLFDQVVQKNGMMRWSARNEQALIERKLGKPKDALALYDEVLKSDAPQSEKKEALCGKGDIFFEMGESENYQHAIEIYDQLASDDGEPAHWRNQALFKKALCLEKKNDRARPRETFY